MLTDAVNALKLNDLVVPAMVIPQIIYNLWKISLIPLQPGLESWKIYA